MLKQTKNPLEQVISFCCFLFLKTNVLAILNLEWIVMSVQRLVIFVLLFIEDAIKCYKIFQVGFKIEMKIKGNMPMCCAHLAAKLYTEFEKIE